MQPMFSLSSLFPALDRGNVDILAAGLTITPNRLQDFRATPAYYYASQLVVYKKEHGVQERLQIWPKIKGH